MTVKEFKKIAPLADSYEFKSGTRYIVQLPADTSFGNAQIVFRQLEAAGVNALVVVGKEIQFFDLQETLSEPKKATAAEASRS